MIVGCYFIIIVRQTETSMQTIIVPLRHWMPLLVLLVRDRVRLGSVGNYS